MAKGLDALKTFYGPHPGTAFTGAAIPLPAAVKKVADELNGKIMTLREAVTKIQASTDGKVTIMFQNKWIMLVLKEPDGTQHGFRVISFENQLRGRRK